MAQANWRRYHFPILQAGCVMKPFLKPEHCHEWASRIGVKLIGIGNMKGKDAHTQQRIWAYAKGNSQELVT